MIINFIILVGSGTLVVGAVRYLLMPGIVNLGISLKVSCKVRGQMTGLATSIPEFTILVAGALAGVFDAGLWNIVSSNIINLVFFIITIFIFRQQLDLRNKKFVDEITFGLLSVAIPLLFLLLQFKSSVISALVLFGVFIIYRIFDRLINKSAKPAPIPLEMENGSLWKGFLFLIIGLGVIMLAGSFLSTSTGFLVIQLNVPAWAIGWILGLVSSMSEFTSFIEIYRIHKQNHKKDYNRDTQEALDALVASNISNLGLILPLAMLVYLLVS